VAQRRRDRATMRRIEDAMRGAPHMLQVAFNANLGFGLSDPPNMREDEYLELKARYLTPAEKARMSPDLRETLYGESPSRQETSNRELVRQKEDEITPAPGTTNSAPSAVQDGERAATPELETTNANLAAMDAGGAGAEKVTEEVVSAAKQEEPAKANIPVTGKTWEEHMGEMTLLNTVANLPALLQKRQEVAEKAVPKLPQASWRPATPQLMDAMETQADRGMRSLMEVARRYGMPGMVSTVDKDAQISQNAMKLAEIDQTQMNQLNAMNTEIATKEALMGFQESQEARRYQFETDKILAKSKADARDNIMKGLFGYTQGVMDFREKIGKLDQWYRRDKITPEQVNDVVEGATADLGVSQKQAGASLLGAAAAYQHPLKVIDKIPLAFPDKLTTITSTNKDEFSKLINRDIAREPLFEYYLETLK
jgi:hypothetical protein